MRHKTTTSVSILIIMLCITTFILNTVQAQPIIASVNIMPAEPIPFDTITVTAMVTVDETIEEVWITIKECNATTGICYPGEQNVTMDIIPGTDEYAADVILQEKGATYISYFIDVKVEGIWYTFDDFDDVNLKLETNDEPPNGNGGTNGNNDDTTPGFEIGTTVTAFVLITVLFRRKRSR